jgi:hypothetical protein
MDITKTSDWHHLILQICILIYRPLTSHTLLKRCKYQSTPREIRKELLRIIKTVLKQNYFNFKNTTYTQPEGLAMGAPKSAIFSELYLQKIEHTDLITILINNNVHGYYRYIDDILLIYDVTLTDINTVLEQFNKYNSQPRIHYRTCN